MLPQATYDVKGYPFLAKGDGIADDTAAIQAAIDAAGAQGGGRVFLPKGTYIISPLSGTTGALSFKSWNNVSLEGEMAVFNLTQTPLPSTVLSVATGVYGVKMTSGSINPAQQVSTCAIRNLLFQSTGFVAGTGTHAIQTAGVEYGVFIEASGTIMENVVVYGFQYGCVIAQSGNGNMFRDCSFVWNTRIGFLVTVGTAAGYALHHPNIVAPSTIGASSWFFLDHCLVYRNIWGFVCREGVPKATWTDFEKNYAAAVMLYLGPGDLIGYGIIQAVFDSCWMEANWSGFDSSLAYPYLTDAGGTKGLYDSAGTPLTLTQNNDRTLSDYGFNIYLMSSATGAQAGPLSTHFIDLRGSLLTDSQVSLPKLLYDKVSTLTRFTKGNVGGSDAWAIRFGSGSFQSTAPLLDDFGCNVPALMPNRAVRMYAETSDPEGVGGITLSPGHFAASGFKFPSTPVPSSDVNTLDDYKEGTWNPTLTFGTSGSVTYNATFTGGRYTKIGRIVHIEGEIQLASTSSPLGLVKIAGLPYSSAAGQANYRAVAILHMSLVAGITSALMARLANATTTVEIFKAAAGTSVPLDGADLTTNTNLTINFSYSV